MNSQESTEHYINKLAKYGPSLNNNNSFAESKNSDAFNFKIDCCENYSDAIYTLIKRDKPAVIVVNGQAGDGKTHLILNLLSEKFHINIKFGMEDKTYREIEEFQSKSDESQRKCPVWIVSDCSEFSDTSPDKEILLQDIASILDANDNEESAVNKIIIVAANKGILLQYFDEICNSSKLCDKVAKDGFEKKYLKPLMTYFLGDSYSCCHDGYLKTLNVENSKLHGVQTEKLFIVDMSSMVNYELICSIIDDIFDSSHFIDCNNCKCKGNCPIFKNYQTLSADNKRFKYGLASIIMLLIANGAHINLRKILIILSNALLGRWDKNAPLMTCTEIKRLSSEYKVKQVFNYFKYNLDLLNSMQEENTTVIHSNPYDNLFGLNLIGFENIINMSALNEGSVFKLLLSTGIGSLSSIPIDSFLIKCKSEDVKDSQRAFYPVAKYFKLDEEGNSTYQDIVFDKLKADLASVRRNLEEQKAESSSSKKNYERNHQDLLRIIESLRRCFFFTIHDARKTEKKSSRMSDCKDVLDDLYRISRFRYGQSFLLFWDSAKEIKSYVDRDECDDLSDQFKTRYMDKEHFKLVCYGLKALFSDCNDIDSSLEIIKIYFSSCANEINDSNMLSDAFILKFNDSQFAPKPFKWTVSANNSILQLPTVLAGSPSHSLVITPDIYEALAGLGTGALSINYSPKCIAALNIFKEKLSSQVIDKKSVSLELNGIIPISF